MDQDAPEIETIEILELLGKGGMSLVYKARQKDLERIVAVKVLSKMAVRGEDRIKRFQKEARLTSTLEHPNIVKTISFGVSKDGQPYLVMEYLEGLSLADDLKQNGRLKLQKFKDVFLPALSAIGQAHQAGLIHRDIKPGNIMICKNDTGAETVKLVDFGIAKVLGEGETEVQQLTKTGAVLGSPNYMSPEQCQGKTLDGRSDLYSMACVMYETLSGEPPFSGDSLLEVMQKHSAEPPPTVSDLSRKIDIRKELAKVTLWGLAKDPAARPQTASEFARKLNEVLERITLDKVPRLKKSGAASAGTLAQQPLKIGLALLCVIISCTVVFMLSHHESSVHIHRKSADVFKAASSQKDEIEYYRRLARAEKAFGTTSEKLLPSLNDLADCYRHQNKFADAVPLLKRALAIRENVLEPPNDPRVGYCLLDLAECYKHLGKYAEAELLTKRALAIIEKVLPDSTKVATCLSDLAECYSRQGKYADAEPMFRRSLELLEQSLGPNETLTADTLNRLAECYRRQGKYSDAERLKSTTVHRGAANEQ